MSRSRKKNPVRTIAACKSQKAGKTAASRRFRRIAKMLLQGGKDLLPEKSIEITKTYNLGGDGKVYRPDEQNWERK